MLGDHHTTNSSILMTVVLAIHKAGLEPVYKKEDYNGGYYLLLDYVSVLLVSDLELVA